MSASFHYTVTKGLFINKQLYRFSERLTRLVNLSKKRAANFLTIPKTIQSDEGAWAKHMIKRRYDVVFTVMRPFFRLYTRLAYAYRALPAPILPKGEPALILSNHNAALDPFFLALSFRRPIFFVASDHIFRLGLVSRIIRYLVAPIPIVKSQMDLRTLRQIRETIRDGGLVGLFPEGNRSFHGRTMFIPPSTGKLVKQLGCTVLLYRLDGGYLTSPRWAIRRRKGFLQGQVVRRIDPAELARLSPDEIFRIMSEALDVDAFAWQRKKKIPYKGRLLAEGLERTLFVCPKCRGLATLTGRKDLFSCACGLSVRYTTLGFFSPCDDWSRLQEENGTFLDNVSAWDTWQRAELPGILFAPGAASEQACLQDAKQKLVSTERASRSHVLASGNLQLFRDQLVFDSTDGQPKRAFPLLSISRMIVHGPQTLQFTTRDNQVWEVRSKTVRSAYKYLLVFQLLQQHLKGEPYGFFGI